MHIDMQAVHYIFRRVLMTQVCAEFQRRAMGISKHRFYKLRNRVSRQECTDWKPTRRAPSDRRRDALLWLRTDAIRTNGQFVPSDNQVHSPIVITIGFVDRIQITWSD